MSIDVTQTAIYKNVAPCIRKEDQAEFLNAMRLAANVRGFRPDAATLSSAFVWEDTPYGHEWWSELAKILDRSGNGYGWSLPK